MILYLATYPRSGNSLLKNIIQSYYQLPISSVHTTPRLAEQYRKGVMFLTNWREDGQEGDLRFARFDLTRPPYTRNVRYLYPDCYQALTPGHRARLAQDEHWYILKTHYLPYEDYYPGEYVFQVVRHPGLVLSSYRHFQKDFEKRNLSLAQVIRGEVPYGCWSAYHEAWDAVGQRLGERFLRVRFEDTLKTPDETTRLFSAMTGLPVNPQGQLTPFDLLHQKNPRMYRSGGTSDWESNYTPAELKLLEQRHGVALRRYGYTVPTPPSQLRYWFTRLSRNVRKCVSYLRPAPATQNNNAA